MYESEFEKIIEASQNHSLTFFVGGGSFCTIKCSDLERNN